MKRMTNIKLLLESDFVAHHKVHSVVQADCLTIDCEKFDLDDMPSPIQIISFGEGKVSFVNDTYGELEIAAYEKFIDQCKKPSSFLNGRMKCDYLAAHKDVLGYTMLIELTSALGFVENLSKPDKKFKGGKYEKSEYQLANSLKDLLSVASIKTYLESKAHRVCLMAYSVNPHTDSEYLKKHPFERYLQIESKTTGEDGALMESPAINALGFEYRRINHNYAFSLS